MPACPDNEHASQNLPQNELPIILSGYLLPKTDKIRIRTRRISSFPDCQSLNYIYFSFFHLLSNFHLVTVSLFIL